MTAPGTLCLANGDYKLQTPLRIGTAQKGLTIVAENGATLSAAAGFEPAFGDGLVVVAGADGVTLRGLTLIPPAAAVLGKLFEVLQNLIRIAQPPSQMNEALGQLLKALVRPVESLQVMIGLRAAGCPALTVENCSVTFAAPAGGTSGPQFGIGLLASGDCAQLAVRSCHFDATALLPTQTPALPQTGGFLELDGFVAGQDESIALQGAIGVLASPCAVKFVDAATESDPQDAFTTVPDFTGAIIADNVFAGTMIAVSAFGLLDRARIIDNTVASSSAGIWLRPIEEARFTFTADNKRAALAGDTMWLKLVLLQKETFLTWLLGLLLPLPAGAIAGTFASTTGGASLRVAGNVVAALAGASSGAPAGGMPALAIVTGTFASALDVGPGFVVAENRLQARTPPQYPASVLAVSGRLAVTGNLMSNEQTGSPPSSVALAIYPYDDGSGDNKINIPAPRLCVTGNVLEGSSNLNVLIRPDAASLNLSFPFNTWLPCNASTVLPS
jgi:hypothetical protein